MCFFPKSPSARFYSRLLIAINVNFSGPIRKPDSVPSRLRSDHRSGMLEASERPRKAFNAD
jgi:hypothetical protein